MAATHIIDERSADDGLSTSVLLTRDNNYFNNVYITVALSPGGIISGWYSVVLTALYH